MAAALEQKLEVLSANRTVDLTAEMRVLTLVGWKVGKLDMQLGMTMV